MTMRSTRLLALIGTTVLALAACGGGSAADTSPTLPSLSQPTADAEPGTTTTTTAVDPEEAMQEYTECMREHGIEMPDFGSGSGGVVTLEADNESGFEAFEEAAAECDPILKGAFGEFELTPEQEAEFMDQELAFAQCMRDNGVDWPDPTSSGNSMIELGDDLDPETVDAAIETCSAGMFGEGGAIIGSGSTP